MPLNASTAGRSKKTHIAALIFGSCCMVASRTYALEACESTNYVAAVDKIIDSAVGGQSQLAITTFPSFESEYGVRMVGSDVYFVQLRTSFWGSNVVEDGPGSYHHDFSSPRADTSVYKSALSRDVANRVKQIYSSAIARTKASFGGGLDGTTYRFALQAVGCGKTWSPDQKSLDGHLVELTELLAAHARLTWSFSLRRSEDKILRKLSEIDQRFPKH